MNKLEGLMIALAMLFSLQFSYGQVKDEVQFLQQIGILDSTYSNSLAEYKKFYVQLPASYDPSTDTKYPVAFILDGEVFLPTVSNVQDFYSGGFTPEMILVGISNAENRTRDLTALKPEEGKQNMSKTLAREATNFTIFLADELIPYIEQNYPVTNFRTLIGHSYGGLFTMHTLVNNSELFSNYVAIDPSLDVNSQELLAEAKEKLPAMNFENKSLFMSLSGTLHMQKPGMTIEEVKKDTSGFTSFARANIAFSDLLEQTRSTGLTYEWKFYPRDLHGTVPFPSIMDGLISVFQWFQMENITKFNDPSTRVSELTDIVRFRSTKLEQYFGYKVPPYPDFLLNVMGYMSMDMEQMDKAKMYFEFNIEYYPNSPNSYDSMADYYERTGDFASALENVTKAYEISKDEYYKERIESLKQK